MAEENIALKISVENTGAKSLKDLKQEFKDLQKELSGLEIGSQKYIETLKKLGATKDDIGDLNQTIAAFNPDQKLKAFSGALSGVASGFSAVTAASALFGTENKDLEKTLVKVQAAMAFSQAINQLGDLKDGFKNLGLVIKAAFASNPLGVIATGIAAIATALTAFYYSMDKSSESTRALNKELEIQKASNEVLSRQIQRQISGLQAQGKSEKEIIEAKRTLIKAQIAEIETSIKLHESKVKDIQDNNTLQESYLEVVAALNRKLGFTKEAEIQEAGIQALKRERAKEDLDAIAKEKQDLLDLKQNFENLKWEEINLNKKVTDEYLKELEKRKQANRALQVDELERIDLFNTEKEAKDQEQQDKEAANQIAVNTAKYEAEKKLADDIRAYKEAQQKATEDAIFQTSVASLNSLANLSNVLFDIRRKNLEAGSKKELEVAKRQFNINKALSASSNIISTIQGVTNALSAKSIIPEPLATALRVANAASIGIAGAANTAKILSQQFNENGGSGGGGSVSVPNISAPNISPPTQGSTLLNADGTVRVPKENQVQTVRAVVTETDITKTQKRISSIETNSKI